jgi:hypothetical protein
LNATAGERARIYLTNSLTGWAEEEHRQLPFPELTAEREAAEQVKRDQPILVIFGNPPYNGYAGVSPAEEGGLVEPYKEGLAADWDITKHKLDDSGQTERASAPTGASWPSRSAGASVRRVQSCLAAGGMRSASAQTTRTSR